MVLRVKKLFGLDDRYRESQEQELQLLGLVWGEGLKTEPLEEAKIGHIQAEKEGMQAAFFDTRYPPPFFNFSPSAVNAASKVIQRSFI